MRDTTRWDKKVREKKWEGRVTQPFTAGFLQIRILQINHDFCRSNTILQIKQYCRSIMIFTDQDFTHLNTWVFDLQDKQWQKEGRFRINVMQVPSIFLPRFPPKIERFSQMFRWSQPPGLLTEFIYVLHVYDSFVLNHWCQENAICSSSIIQRVAIKLSLHSSLKAFFSAKK